MAYPDWLLGRGLTTISVVPGTMVAGIFTAGTSKSFFTCVDEIEWSVEPGNTDIRPITQFHRHMVPTSRGNGFRLREILRATASTVVGASGNSLADMFVGFEYFSVVFTRATRTFTGYYSNGGYTENPAAEKSTGTATFLPIAEEALTNQTWVTGSNMAATGAGI
jgi:hypothetical protein